MKLRNKVMLVIGLVWAGFAVIIYFGANLSLIRSFQTLESVRVKDDVNRVTEAMNAKADSVAKVAANYSKWTGAYLYISGNAPRFAQENITPVALQNVGIHLMSYWDKAGRFVGGIAIDEQGKQTVMPNLGDHIRNSALTNLKFPRDVRSGFYRIGDALYIFGESTITDTDQLRPVTGMVVIGEKLTQAFREELVKTTRIRFQYFTLDEALKNPSITNEVKLLLDHPSQAQWESESDNLMKVFYILKDISGQPIGVIVMERPQDIISSGHVAINYFMKGFIILGLIFTGLMIYIFRVIIIRRLEKLAHEVYEIASNARVWRRVTVTGKDELSYVSNQINEMLSVIDKAHNKLETQVEERTQALSDEIITRKRFEKELLDHKEYLKKMAHFDKLTNLPNQILFNEKFNDALITKNEAGSKLALLFLDLDNFKRVNDALSHRVGDQLLKQMSARFEKIIQGLDLCARAGGDEFIFMIYHSENQALLEKKCDELLQICRDPIKVMDHEFYMSASIGVSLFPDHGESLEDLQMNADIAMYYAKRSGGNAAVIYREEMSKHNNHNIKLEAAIRRGIKEKEFVVYFQPKFSLKQETIVSAEALMRWHHPELGFVTPDQFIPYAEESGLILQLGEYILRETCRINKEWQTKGYDPIAVAVNVSIKQLLNQDIVAMVKDALEQSGLAPAYLEIEVTESAIMQNMQVITEKLHQLAALGVKIAIDDFGTGSTTIKHLRDFPISVVKIDQSFIKGLPQNQNDIFITNAIIGLAHNLGVNVVAEGVETVEQFEFLAEHGCDLIQGYLVGRPVRDYKFEGMLTKEKTPL